MAIVTADRPDPAPAAGQDYSFLTSRRKYPAAEYVISDLEFHTMIRRAAAVPEPVGECGLKVIGLRPSRQEIRVVGRQGGEFYYESVQARTSSRTIPPIIYLHAVYLEALLGKWPLVLTIPYKSEGGRPVVFGRPEDAARAVLACCDPAPEHDDAPSLDYTTVAPTGL